VKHLLTGTLEKDWERVAALWRAADVVYQAITGPLMKTHPEHEACILFAKYHPGSRDFLVRQVETAEPMVAAYAFKCLVRVADITAGDLTKALKRTEVIRVTELCASEDLALGEFVKRFFDSKVSRKSLLKFQDDLRPYQEPANPGSV
jgi:hypothetical protein